MTYRGHIQGGVVVLDEQVALADGTRVTISVAEPPEKPFGQALEKLAGKAVGLPRDLAERHDEYRRQRNSR